MEGIDLARQWGGWWGAGVVRVVGGCCRRVARGGGKEPNRHGLGVRGGGGRMPNGGHVRTRHLRRDNKTTRSVPTCVCAQPVGVVSAVVNFYYF